MVSKQYRLIIAPQVIEKIEHIRDYLLTKASKETVTRFLDKLLFGLEGLCLFPEAGFDADEKLGVTIDDRYAMRGMILHGQYIVFYWIDDSQKTVNIAYLFSTREDYYKAFKK